MTSLSISDQTWSPRPWRTRGAGVYSGDGGGALKTDEFLPITEQLRDGQAIRSRINGVGRLHLDRPLPFLFVHRRRSHPDPGTARLLSGEASFLLLEPPERRRSSAVDALLTAVLSALSERFGGVLLLELWSGGSCDEGAPLARVLGDRSKETKALMGVLARQLERNPPCKRAGPVEVVAGARFHPPGERPLLTPNHAAALGCRVMGLEIAPQYQVPGGTIYPQLLRSCRRALSRNLRRTVHAFARRFSREVPPSYLALGRSFFAPAVWTVDQRLADLEESFDFLLEVTPLDTDKVWRRFQRSGFQRTPRFTYRPQSVDPTLMKRKLFAIPVERIEDPALEELFREKQRLLDRQLTMLLDLGTRRFLPGSVQVYGAPGPGVLAAARTILAEVPSPRQRPGAYLDADAFADAAREEVQRYRALDPSFEGPVLVRDDLYPGLLVSRGRLLIGRLARSSPQRVKALLAHEVGTHMVTWHNGGVQPFRQLRAGLAGYEELQEGLAVLGEYLVGGLHPERLRLLAARVVAVHAVMEGADFVEVFRLLHDGNGFDGRTSWAVAMRIFRGGGLTKDAIYLRGLLKLLDYLRDGGDLETLYVGKIAAHHVNLIRELAYRDVLREVPLTPFFLREAECLRRLERVRKVEDLRDLLPSAAPRGPGIPS